MARKKTQEPVIEEPQPIPSTMRGRVLHIQRTVPPECWQALEQWIDELCEMVRNETIAEMEKAAPTTIADAACPGDSCSTNVQEQAL